MKDFVRKAMEKALIDIDGKLWGNTCVPDVFVEKFADYLLQTKPLSDEEIQETWESLFENEDDIVHIHNFARAIEAKVRGQS